MIQLLTQFAAEAEGLPLGINPEAFLIQLATFAIAFFVLRKWAFGPIMKRLEERRRLIEDGITLGEKMRVRETQAEAEAARRVHEARQQADQIVAAAHAEAKQAVQSAEEAARERADDIIREANEQIRQAAVRERKRLEQEIAGLVSEVSEAIIGEKVDAKKDAALIDKALKERQAA